MEFGGVVGMEGLVGSSESGSSSLFSSPLVSSDPESSRQKGFGSDFLKQGRSGEERDWRCLKVARTGSMLMSPTRTSSSLLRSNAHTLFPEGQQMLSFSTSRPEALVLDSGGTLPFCLPLSSLPASSASYVRNAGQSSAGSFNMNMHGVLTGVRGPFTPSQWLELEHQALIYKYINANVPIPSKLLIPIRKSLNPSMFSGYSAASFRPSSLGWGPFHLGFSGNTDPEPGRCRRTDGKKWRCSRDAVADQKYCERHMNRGRHRSRKPVEGHNGHAAKVVATPSPAASSAISGSGPSNGIAIAQQQIKTSQPASTDSSVQFNRSVLNKENVNEQLQDLQSQSMPTSMTTNKPRDNLLPMPKHHNPFEISSSVTDFGLVSSDSLMNPARSFASSPDLTEQEPHQPHHHLRHFIDDWPKNHSDRSTISWDVEEIQSDRTQLSISIPRPPSDFSSSTSSPAQEKLTLSPLRLSREFDPIHMGLGVGGVLNDVGQRQSSWIPISWETSMCGPLGEVLKNTNNTPRDHSKHSSSSALNLMTGGWDSSPRLGSSPTGVLQKSTFGSLSSSTGSSPRTDNHKTHDNSSILCDDLLGSTLLHSNSIPLCKPSA